MAARQHICAALADELRTDLEGGKDPIWRNRPSIRPGSCNPV
jgi:hypothetical protein